MVLGLDMRFLGRKRGKKISFIRKILIIRDFAPVLLLRPFIAVTLVSAFLVFALRMCRRPEGCVGNRRECRSRRTDHLAVIVDTLSFAQVAAWEGAEVDHHPVFE